MWTTRLWLDPPVDGAVDKIIYDDPYDGWVLEDEAKFGQVELKALGPDLYEGMHLHRTVGVSLVDSCGDHDRAARCDSRQRF
jgi:hypothetical protein